MAEPRMPADWNDAEGWEHYYQALLGSESRPDPRMALGSFSPTQLPTFVTDLRERGWRSVWVPGCGLSPLPKLLAHLGLSVYATDISPAAVAFQQSADNDVGALLPGGLDASDAGGKLLGEVHDFRTPYLAEHFDLIINQLAFQGFLPETMREVAAHHYQALRPGRYAYFDTMNVQGERRDLLEETLVEAGFFVPLYELNRWYRRALQETGISHLFIMGRPMIPKTGPYAEDGARWQQDTAVLRAISQEFFERAQAEHAAEIANADPEARTAMIIYSTG